MVYVLFPSNQIWVMAMSVCLIFAITIGVFPAVTVDVKSTIANGGPWGKARFSLVYTALYHEA